MSDVCAICQKSLSSRMSVERADGSFECLRCAKANLKQSMDVDREKINRALVTRFLAHDSDTNKDRLISVDEALPIAEVAAVVDKKIVDKKIVECADKENVDKAHVATKKDSAVIGSLPLLKVEEVDLRSGSASQAGRELAAVVNKLARDRKTLMNRIKQLELTICSQQEKINELSATVSVRAAEERDSVDSSLMGVNANSHSTRKAPPIVSSKNNIRSIWEKSVLGRNRNKKNLRGSNNKRLESAKNMVLIPLNAKGEQMGAAFVNGGREAGPINKI